MAPFWPYCEDEMGLDEGENLGVDVWFSWTNEQLQISKSSEPKTSTYTIPILSPPLSHLATWPAMRWGTRGSAPPSSMVVASAQSSVALWPRKSLESAAAMAACAPAP